MSDSQESKRIETEGSQGEVSRIDHPTREPSALTTLQKDLLTSAVENGYFRVPRETTLITLAEEHGITAATASEQLREGLDAVLRNALDENTPPGYRN